MRCDLMAPRPRVNRYPIDEMRVLREALAFESSQALAMYGAAMRTTDPEPAPFRPLGEKVEKPVVAPMERWKPLEHNRQVEQNTRTGELRSIDLGKT